MSTGSENFDHIADLQRRKDSLREHLRNLSPTAKIVELEALQERYYELLKIRHDNGGIPIPSEWERWHRAQEL